ncbi:hypothetical protein, conserved [Eimeria brunetti]|uniref:CRAL-TRIO domain-containing protein n=1 Tax=Eimeria brunetti TaxID=51314 RepID=U6LDT6_9EIME|nr:hypothetical protein, conserved [Eimeria brunetti]
MKPRGESPGWQGQHGAGQHATEKVHQLSDAPETLGNAGDDGEAAEWPRVVEGRLLYQGEVKVGNRILPVCEEASFSPRVPEDPEAFAEAFAGYYDGNFPETTQHDVSSLVKIKAPIKCKNDRKEEVKAHLEAKGHLVIGALPQSEGPAAPEGRDLFAPYEQKLAKFIVLISSLSGNCAWYVVEDMRRLLYMRDGKVSRSADLSSRKEACNSLARLACLRKSLAEVEEQGGRFTRHSSADALLELESRLAGALAYRSADGKHPAVYIPVASLIPTSIYLQVTPAGLQRTLLKVFGRTWSKLASASRRHGEKISHVLVVLDFSDMSQLDLAAYSTHRLLGDIGEVLRAYCPWLVYKIIIFKLRFAREFLWELLRRGYALDKHLPALRANCFVVTAETEGELLQEIQADGTFILHTLGGFNECSLLRCRRPIYRLPEPPQPMGASEWFSEEEDATAFWEEMEKLYEEAPEAPPEGEPVDGIQAGGHEEISATLSRRMQEESREKALQSKEKELEELIHGQECLVPHFQKALKQVFVGKYANSTKAAFKKTLEPKKEPARPSFSMNDVTKSDVHICIWKPPRNEVEAANETAQMLLKIFEKRSLWTHPSLPPNYMHAFERTTYPLDCVYHSRHVSPMRPPQTPLSVCPTPTKDGLSRTGALRENRADYRSKVSRNAHNFL